MKITVLTSSRADYGILRPLIVELNSDKEFDLRIVAFGSHNSKFYGNTAQEIEKDGLKIFKKIDTLLIDDSPVGISKVISVNFTHNGYQITFTLVCQGKLSVLGV